MTIKHAFLITLFVNFVPADHNNYIFAQTGGMDKMDIQIEINDTNYASFLKSKHFHRPAKEISISMHRPTQSEAMRAPLNKYKIHR